MIWWMRVKIERAKYDPRECVNETMIFRLLLLLFSACFHASTGFTEKCGLEEVEVSLEKSVAKSPFYRAALGSWLSRTDQLQQ